MAVQGGASRGYDGTELTRHTMPRTRHANTSREVAPTNSVVENGAPVRTEWLGCFAASAWAYGLIYSFGPVMAHGHVYLRILVMLLLASMAATAIGCQQDFARLSRLTVMTTPVAAVGTAVMWLFPEWANLLTNGVTMLCLGPLLVRRLSGLVEVARGTGRQAVLIALVPAVMAFHAVWVMLPVPVAIRFVILAVVGATGLRGVGRIPPPAADQSAPAVAWSRRGVVLLCLYLPLVIVTDCCYQYVIVTIAAGWGQTYPWSWLAAMVVVGAVALVSALVSDQGTGRAWVVIGLSVVMTGLFLSLTPDLHDFEPVLLLVYGAGAGVSLYVLLTLPMPDVFVGRRTMLFACLGAAYIGARAVGLDAVTGGVAAGQTGGLPAWFYVVLLVLTALFYLVSILMMNYSDARVVAEAIIAILAVPGKEVPKGRPLELIASELDAVDRKIVALLVDGHDATEIAARLLIPPDEVDTRIAEIRSVYVDPGAKRHAAALAEIVERHELTAREAEILGDIAGGLSNAEIAQSRFITDRTVKFHVGNLLAKLGAGNRREVRELVERAEAETAS